MKYRIYQTSIRVSGERIFFYAIEGKRHWWSRWMTIMDADSFPRLTPLLFSTRDEAEDYIKEK